MSTTSITLLVACIAVLLSPVTVSTAEKIKPPTVNLKKCCPLGQYLDITQHCVVGGTDKWVPSILLISKGKLFVPIGEAPRFFRIADGVQPSCSTPLDLYTGSLVVSSNGSLFVQEISRSFAAADFCVDKDAALVCQPPPPGSDVTAVSAPELTPADIPANMINTAGMSRASASVAPRRPAKLRKCCGPDYVYDRNQTNCKPLDADSPHRQRSVTNRTAGVDVDMIFGFPRCVRSDASSIYTMVEAYRDENWDAATGRVRLAGVGGRTFNATEFCVEHTVDDAVYADVHVFTCAEHFGQQDPEWAATGGDKEDIRYVLLAIGLFISVVFLTATLATAFLLPSSHHVLHWRCQTFYVACLLVGDLLLAITQLSRNGLPSPFCSIIASGMHFFFLAAFFWLNTMCFNIWWTFRDFRPTSLEKSQELLRLRIYQVYAWGVPLIISAVAAILDNMPPPAMGDGAGAAFLRPRFGEKGCWFAGDIEIFTYFFGPIGVLLIINFLLFASTARQLTCGLWKRDDVKSTTERSALGRVCLKLVVVMGVTWVADVLSWAVGGPRYFWYVTDVINALQGVLIFIVVGCQPQVWTAVKRLWSMKTGRGDTMNTTNGAQNSSSSHGLPSIGESVTNHTHVTTAAAATPSTNGKMPMETIC